MRQGLRGVIDLARIVSVAKELADADIYCFQEVSNNFMKLDGGADQSAQLAWLLPGYRPLFRPAIETIDGDGQTHCFGNMTLSRLPVLQIANHLLPWPGAFNFVTEDLTRRLRRVEVDGKTDASDHQPILIELAD